MGNMMGTIFRKCWFNRPWNWLLNHQVDKQRATSWQVNLVTETAMAPFWTIWLVTGDRATSWQVTSWPLNLVATSNVSAPECTWAHLSVPECAPVHLAGCIALSLCSPLISALPRLRLSTTWAFFNQSFCISLFLREILLGYYSSSQYNEIFPFHNWHLIRAIGCTCHLPSEQQWHVRRDQVKVSLSGLAELHKWIWPLGTATKF